MVEVGNVRRPLPATPDLDRLPEGVQEAVAERVPDVRVVEAATGCRHITLRGICRIRFTYNKIPIGF